MRRQKGPAADRTDLFTKVQFTSIYLESPALQPETVAGRITLSEFTPQKNL